MKLFLPGVVFVTVFFVDFLMHEIPGLPSSFRYAPDLTIAMVAAVAIARIVFLRRIGSIQLRHWLFFLSFVYVAVSAAIINGVSPDVTIGGIRFYFRYVPLFLLPFAFDYTERDLNRLFILLIALALIQIPVAFRQRFVEYASFGSGDVITGTLSLSTSLTLFCVGMIIAVAALYIDKRVSLTVAAGLGFLFLLPAAINETKVTPIALGIGAIAVLLARVGRIEKRRIVVLSSSGVLLLGVFIGIYDRLYTRDGGDGYLDFISSPKSVIDRYSLRGVKAKNFDLVRDRNQLVAKPVRLTEQATWIGRLDSLTIAFQVLSKEDPVRLAFGLGMGSVSSDFGAGGEYRYLSDELGATMTTLTQVLWELGVSGALLSVTLISLFTRDAWKGATSPTGTFCVVFFGIGCSVLVTLLYANYILLYEVTCLIAFYFGAVARRSTNNVLRARDETTRRTN